MICCPALPAAPACAARSVPEEDLVKLVREQVGYLRKRPFLGDGALLDRILPILPRLLGDEGESCSQRARCSSSSSSSSS